MLARPNRLPADLVADALLTGDRATIDQMALDAAAEADAAIALHYAERGIAEQGDPWALAQGVPVGRGAAPLSGPCCEEPAQ